MSALPKSWDQSTVGNVCVTMKGKKPRNSGNRTDQRTVPYINIKAFESGLAKEFAEPGEYPTCNENDVLIVWDGARSGLTGRGVSGYIGSTLARISSPSLGNNFLFYFLQSKYGEINSRTKGVGIPHVDPQVLNAIAIPVPPSLEQRRIVAEIERQFTRLEAGVAAVRRVQANLKRYRAAVLKAACEGHLVPTEAELAKTRNRKFKFETGEALLARILAVRRQTWQGRGKYKESAAPDTTKLPPLPEGWTWTRAEQLCEFITKGTTPAAEKMHAGAGEVPFIKVYNLTFTGVLNLDYKPVFISRKTHEVALKRSEVRARDILINIVGPPLGQVSIVPPTIKQANINQAIARFRVVLPECQRLLALYLMAEPIIGWAVKRAKTTAGQSNLTLELCRDLPIPLPPLPEQARIVTEVERRLSVVAELEKLVSANLQRATRLRQSILQKAFTGGLA